MSTPYFDVIMPTCVTASETIICNTLTSLRECTVTDDYRLIIVVNAEFKPSIDKLTKMMELVRDYGPEEPIAQHAWLTMEGISGFSRACNLGLTYSTAPWLCLLSDDVILAPRWDEIMIGHLKDTGAALCDPASKRPGRATTLSRYEGKASPVFVDHMVPFFAPVFPRWTMEKYGLLSMHPDLAQLGNDSEYCSRILKGGDKIIVATDCVCDPLQRTTIGEICKDNMSEVEAKVTKRLRELNAHPGCI
jgi:hypothetical protein